MLSDDKCNRALISVAFAQQTGVEDIASQLMALKTKVDVYVGIRNDITSGQALLALLKTGVNVYAVDTGTTAILFHPKVYFVACDETATSLIGSANLTFSGLNNNIEASTKILLQNSDEDDAAYIEKVYSLFDSLQTAHPENILTVSNARQVVELMQQGRLTDERVRIVSTRRAKPRHRGKDLISRIKIPFLRPPQKPKAKARKRLKSSRTVITSPHAKASGDYKLVWVSGELKERDLNIPTGKNTNPTGSMLLKKGKLEEIDQRHFFYDEVFNGLTWTPSAGRPHLHKASCNFCIVIKGSDYGVYNLRLTHNTDVTSKTYKQNNGMTSLSWGDARKIVGKKDLLGSTMKLYRGISSPDAYVIEFVD